MTKSGVCNASAMCRQSVGQLVGSLGLVLLATFSAQAGAWEEFEARCLVPMENVERSNVSELVPRGKSSPKPPFARYYSPLDWSFAMQISGDASWCGIIFGNPSPEAFDELAPFSLNWITKATESGRYVELPTVNHRRKFQSTEWREPRIEVSVRLTGEDMENGEAVLIVQETDLES